jgi:PII-like signaling protein
MSLVGEQILLRIYLRGADRAPHVPTATRIVQAARQQKLAGVTVLRGIMGFGRRGVAQASAWSIIDHSPAIVEIVDSAAAITGFIRGPLHTIMAGGLLTLERAAVMMYRHRRNDAPGPLRLAAALKPLSTLPVIETGENMIINQDGVLLRVFIGDSDRFEKRPLYEAILQKARELGLSGATVLRGSEGFGANSVVHKSALLEMSSDLPVVIEIVESQEKISLLLPHLETMVLEGMITMEQVHICSYRHNPADAPGGPA